MFSKVSNDEKSKISFEDDASIISRYLLLYLNPLFQLGVNQGVVDKTTGEVGRELCHEDLGATANQDSCGTLYEKFTIEWAKEIEKDEKKRSLWGVLFRTVGYMKLVWAIGLYALYSAVAFGPILILTALVQHFQGTNILPDSYLWLYVGLMLALPVVGAVFSSESNVMMAHIGIQIRNILITAIYRKAMKLSPSARQMTSTGQIVNMFSNDTGQLQRFLFFVNNCALAPATIAVALALVYQQVGPSTFFGLALMVVLMPVNGVIFGIVTWIRTKKVIITDERVKLMNEILSGIRVIKYYAWEDAFQEKITAIRTRELEVLKQLAYVFAFGFTLVLMAAPILQPVVIFYAYVRLGNQLDAAKVFTTIALFNLMQFPFAFLPMGIAQYSQSLVSTARMLKYLSSEELQGYVDRNADSANQDGFVIKVNNASLCWIKEDDLILIEEAKEAEAAAKSRGGGGRGGGRGRGEAAGRGGRGGAGRGNGNDATKTTSDVKDDTKGEYELVKAIDDKDGKNDDPGMNRSCHTLNDINLEIKRGQLVAVVGPVGCGKSSFLSAILGELNLKPNKEEANKAYVRVVGSIAYCDQRPWIINDTVKNNILFGLPFDQARFDLAKHSANLEDDIKQWEGGVETEIGERGINLSGGQKARVALARAVYRDTDVYLLDDPLSAVDAFVGQHIFHECIKGTLADKTRILVTHHVHLLPFCDHIIVLQDGSIQAQGSYDELQAAGVDKLIEQLIPTTSEEQSTTKSAQATPEASATSSAPPSISLNASTQPSVPPSASTQPSVPIASPVEGASKEEGKAQESTASSASIDKASSENPLKADEAEKKADVAVPDNRSSKIMTIEERKLGDVESRTYTFYLKSGGWQYFFMMVLAMLSGQALQIVSNFWLAYWGLVSVRSVAGGASLSSEDNIQYLNYYAMFACLSLVCQVIRALFLAQHRLGTSTILHRDTLKKTLGAPIAFYDVTPLGRILNRFSSDMLCVDEELSQTISQVTNSLASCLGGLGAIAGATKGTFCVLMVPLLFVYNAIQEYFRKTNTTVARLEAISRSPVYADFSQVLTGTNSIRAYNEQSRFINSMEKTLNRNTIAGIIQQIAGQWLAIRLDLLGAIITFFVSLITAATAGLDFIPAGFLGVGLTYSFQITTYLKFCVRMMATGEAQMNSVERLMFYIENINQEEDEASLKSDHIPANWPSNGTIEGEDVQMGYRDGPLVLKGVNFRIEGKEKIGIAGRTGSGKSSMMNALFRIENLEKGQIKIDGIDIATIPVRILRKKLGIIPQDPVMFSEKVRFNLDPFGEHDDAKLLQVLDDVNLRNHINSLPGTLDAEVAEGGDNFSAGQRQLICIARALLRDPSILVLDEATASIDNDTDKLIQDMIRKKFKNSTVLTIAHRLHTIVDSDKIMVLDAGLLAEMDSPENLLKKEDGVFKGLWDRHKDSHSKSLSYSNLAELSAEDDSSSTPEVSNASSSDVNNALPKKYD